MQALIDNPLPHEARAGFIGLIGDHPSTYARSPRMWAPALDALGIDASYLPLDVRPDRLADLVGVLRRDACLGANVTVPYKEPVARLLDDVDATATAVGAVNTIVRTADGRLVGSNTDGAGLITALMDAGEKHPLVERLEGTAALLIGAGGAARAAAVALAPLLGTGELFVTNRSHDRAQAVAVLARARGARARAVIDEKLDAVLPGVGLVINASLRGQAGLHRRTAPAGAAPSGARPAGWTVLESYSALAPAAPAVLAAARKEDVLALWEKRSARDVEVNHSISRARMRMLPPDAVVYDMIYAPAETVTLRHAREADLRAANGRTMNIAQGVAACVDHICRRHLTGRGADLESARATVRRLMAEAWDA